MCRYAFHSQSLWPVLALISLYTRHARLARLSSLIVKMHTEDTSLVQTYLGTTLSPQFELRLCQAKPGRMQEQLASLRFQVTVGGVSEGCAAAKSV